MPSQNIKSNSKKPNPYADGRYDVHTIEVQRYKKRWEQLKGGRNA